MSKVVAGCMVAESLFERVALASGLIRQEDLDEAHAVLGAGAEEPDGLRLADWLVAERRLTQWQAWELFQGRTKFTLGPYRLIEAIGQGGMGQVFKAEHPVMGRTVAVKIMPQHKVTPDSIAAFHREIRIQARLDHDNLVRAYDAGCDEDVHFLVMEHVPGTDLRRLVKKHKRLSQARAAAIIVQAAQGLQYAHEQGVIHRDVKPSNLLVTPSGHAKLSDLGLVAFFRETDSSDPRGEKVVGSSDYFAPEQITDPAHPTPLSDIYALGCTLYYTVTGRVPFPGGTSRSKALAHRKQPPTHPRCYNPKLSEEFVDVIGDMMAKEPRLRTSSAAAVVARLTPFLPPSD